MMAASERASLIFFARASMKLVTGLKRSFLSTRNRTRKLTMVMKKVTVKLSTTCTP